MTDKYQPQTGDHIAYTSPSEFVVWRNRAVFLIYRKKSSILFGEFRVPNVMDEEQAELVAFDYMEV